MVLAYLIPIIALIKFPFIATSALLIMLLTYYPTIRYYRRHWAWTFTLPFAALLYLLMTWTFALRYYRGERSH